MSITEITIEGVNIPEGLARFAKNEKLYVKSLLKFSNDYPPPENYKDVPADELKKYAHMIKGVAGNLGAYDLSAAAAQAEHNTADDGVYSAFVDKMLEMSGIINGSLAGFTGGTAAPKSKSGGGSKEEYLKLIGELKAAADEYNPSECEKIIEKLHSTNWGDIKMPDFEALTRAVDDYDLEDIPAILDKAL